MCNFIPHFELFSFLFQFNLLSMTNTDLYSAVVQLC